MTREPRAGVCSKEPRTWGCIPGWTECPFTQWPVARQKRFSGRDVGRGVKFWVAGGEGCGVLVVTGWPESSEGPGPEGHLSHGEEFWLCPKYSREPSRCCEQE